MKKFLEALAQSNLLYDEVDTNTEAEKEYALLRQKYDAVKGKRALYYCKDDKECRVVRITGTTENCVQVTYNYYGMNYEGTQIMSINFGSLLSIEPKNGVRLEIEQ